METTAIRSGAGWSETYSDKIIRFIQTLLLCGTISIGTISWFSIRQMALLFFSHVTLGYPNDDPWDRCTDHVMSVSNLPVLILYTV
ncbi:hypothetical protein BO86DRAFT_175765 [Aspergillus japonicus CBS 114.51]|uniref:Uncharacterized protein n=1 Tax=Aspergillus japonicus CBS 114.51 TaxID=1448312 RepID=A0A8T8WSP8_ASPJA|nr:hypothetical protein BO86DRAFT_175765 [Aspergillus japonicus CBS 114.51]RAH78700.1 hypothetical protein BO86DRAFT_175765 [Aspergillus japonicus CBS 114.51]